MGQDGHHQDEWGIHHRVLNAVVETPPGQDCFGWVDVFNDRVEVVGFGTLQSATMQIGTEQALETR